MGRKDTAGPYRKFALSLGATALVVMAFSAVEANAQAGAEGMSQLPAVIEPLRPGSRKAKFFENWPLTTSNADRLCTTTAR